MTAARFDRDGETVYNLALRITASPGAAWHATVAAFAAVAERVPADAPPGTDEQDLLLMGCWHARQLLSQLDANPEYAAQLRAHDEANVPMASLQASVVRANGLLPVDQREVLALRGLSRLDHQDLAVLLRADPGVLAAMLAQARLMLRDAMRGSRIAAEALTTPEARQAVALAALRQDGQLRGAEARLTLAHWLDGDESRRAVVDALEEAGLSYRAWARASVPEGLREAAIGAADGVPAPAPAAAAADPDPAPTTAGEATGDPATGDPAAAAVAPDPSAGFPAGQHDVPLDPPATAVHATTSGEGEPGPATGEVSSGSYDPFTGEPVAAAEPPAEAAAGPVPPRGRGGAPDPDATVEWSSSEIAALGLDGDEPSPVEEWDDDWDDDQGGGHGDRLQPRESHGRRAPRWQVAVVGILLVALLIVLALTFLKGDDSTEPTTNDTSSQVVQPAGGAAQAAAIGAAQATIVLPRL
ncbi:hypothetical protein [Patulibacter defluvii]|uniref:hypothetical protein n=1 Tax=Patulibacter defluvii TaxID=3095358 RepID=UPI002A752321|nr:hypothetical protein [Patulibacter sp. DM4]